MDNSEDGDPYATGFEYTRREILQTGTAVGLAATAGCQHDEETTPRETEAPQRTTREPTLEETETPTDTKNSEGIVDPALSVLESGFIEKERGLRNFFRVRLRNDLQDETLSAVGVGIEFYDKNLRFVEQQNATVAYLGPEEVFEGYLSYMRDEAVAYAVRATRSDRSLGHESLSGLSVGDHGLRDEQVRGVVENNGSRRVPRLAVQVAFYDRQGDRLGIESDTITELDAGAAAAFEVDFDEIIADPGTSVADYTVSVGDYGEGVLSIR